MESVGDVIDLDPVVIRVVEERGSYVAIVCSQQPVYSRAAGENPQRVPLYDCEIRIWDADIELMDVALPFETSEWEIRFDGGKRSLLLPVEFKANGPVRLELGPSDVPNIVVSGTAVSLHLGEPVGTFEQFSTT